MLLRSVIDHVKAQNWFAVGLDFVIVVVGVFIGLQFGNWNQTRQQNQLYSEAFDRVIVEVQANLERLESSREDVKLKLPIVQQALEDLRACRSDNVARENIEAAFTPLGSSTRFTIDAKALDQLINNDDFLPFQTPDIRRRLLDLSTYLNSLQRRSDIFWEMRSANRNDTSGIVRPGPLAMKDPDQALEAIKMGATMGSEIVRPSVLAVSLTEACKDEAYLQEFYSWEDTAYFTSVAAGLAIERLHNDLDELGRPDRVAAEARE